MEERKIQFVKDHEVARNEGTLYDFYEKYANAYDDIMSSTGYDEIQYYAAGLLKKFIHDSQSLVLDVGCGTGYSGLFLQKVGFRYVHGTDPSPSSLHEAEKKGGYSECFQGMIAEEQMLSCKPNTYDGIFCIGTITKGHLELKPALKEFERITKAGGFLVFTIRNDKLDQVDMMAVMGKAMDERRVELISIEKKTYYVDAFCLCCVFKVL